MKKGIYNIFSSLVVAAGLNRLAGIFLKRKVFVFIYHSVSHPDNSAELHGELYRHLSIPAARFEEQLKFLKANGHTFLAMRDLSGGLSRIKKPTIVYFDDGYKDNYLNALPILRKLSIPATVFVATGAIDRIRTIWTIEYAQFLRLRGVPESEWKSKIAAYKAIDWAERARRLEAEYRAAGFSGGVPDSIFMTWDEVRDLARQGVEIGSHTVSHPKLTSISSADLRAELVESKARIEQELNKEIVSFSYPYGRSDETTDEAVQAAGYKMTVSKGVGLNRIPESKAQTIFLKNVPVRIGDSLSVFKAKVYFWNLFL
jgi:peptidoglycan/xylan/chitin deacetylase (PgdA/CDA1 family)